ncbi:hypothetical protein U5801_28715, partial [Lamprobacter modestohalophilus]|uniref:hypothetical protein n=1 Tax=Lamprobacter modestohalophilus TaxID=1064514 RepID=UPI002ADEBCDA
RAQQSIIIYINVTVQTPLGTRSLLLLKKNNFVWILKTGRKKSVTQRKSMGYNYEPPILQIGALVTNCI